jgi:hypothetical protein
LDVVAAPVEVADQVDANEKVSDADADKRCSRLKCPFWMKAT